MNGNLRIHVAVAAFSLAFGAAASATESAKPALVSEQYGKLPVSFEANQGQLDSRVQFLARGPGYSLFLAPSEVVLSLRPGASSGGSARRGAVLRMRFGDANPDPELTGVDLQPGTSNYFIGNDRAKWKSRIPLYSRVRYAEVYPGIDLLFYGNQRQLEYDFVVSPGADPGSIALDFDGVETLTLSSDGSLLLATPSGTLVQHRPLVYQEIDGARCSVDGRYVKRGERRAGFEIVGYDPSRPLIIDPTLSYSTYLGGVGTDGGIAIAVDGIGNAYIVGSTNGSFPTTAGALDTTYGGGLNDAFVTKLNAAGNAVVYSTYLGGNDTEQSYDGFRGGIAVDGNGDAYVAGFTISTDFPTTAGVVQGTGGSLGNAFVAKLNATGTALLYSTLLGNNSGSGAYGIAVDPLGNAYITGRAYQGYPTTPGAFWTDNTVARSFAFVTKLNPFGTKLLYSTLIGGAGFDVNSEDSVSYAIAVDANGFATITGVTNDGLWTTANAYQSCPVSYSPFVTRFNQTGTGLVYSSCIGAYILNAIAVDGAGNAYVTGNGFTGMPTTAGAYQTTADVNGSAVLLKFDTNLSGASSLVYSSFLGGAGTDSGTGIAIDGSGNATIVGWTTGSFPTTAGAIQTTYGGGIHDAFVAKMNPNASGAAGLVYSTYLGGAGNDLAAGVTLDTAGNVYVTGQTDGGFPTTAGASDTSFGGGSGDAFVAKLAFVAPAAPTHLAITSVNSGANPTAGSAFTVVVQAQDGSGALQPVASSTGVTLSLHTGTGIVGGTLTCTIPAGSMGCFVSGVTYSKAEPGVALTATRNSGDALAAGNSSPFTVNGVGALVQLAVTSVNAGVSPTSGIGFNVVVQGWDAAGNPQNAVTNTLVVLSVGAGTGSLGGTLGCTILAGAGSCLIPGATYSRAEPGVVLTASAASGDTSLPGHSASFNVLPRLVFASINGGANPAANVAFNIVMQVQEGTATPRNVSANVTAIVTVRSGTGALSGSTLCTILAGNSSCTITGVSYSTAESGVVLSVQGGFAVTGSNSAPFTVNQGRPTRLGLFPGPGFPPVVGVAFGLGAISTDALGAPQNVVASTLVTLTRHSGTGTLGGTLSCTIPAGSYSCQLPGVTYSTAEAGVSVTGTASGGDVLTPYTSPTFTVNPFAAPTKLAIFNVGFPIAGRPFYVEIQAQDSGGVGQNVAVGTVVALSLQTGTGVLGGTLGCTISAGSSFCSTSGTTYSKVESGVVITATRTSGASLTPGNSAPFTVSGPPTQLAFASIGSGTVGFVFGVTVQAQDGTSTAQSVGTATGVALTLKTGTGILTGTLTCTIPAGSFGCSIYPTYSKAESGVVLTATRTSGDALSSVDSAPLTFSSTLNGWPVVPAPTQLAIPGVNGGADPGAGVAFNVVIQAQDSNGIPQNALTNTGVTLSRHTGTGALGGTLTCTINAGSNSCTAPGVTYSIAEAGVSLTATRTSGDTLAPGNSATFTVHVAAGLKFFTLPPCRQLDTRSSAPIASNGTLTIALSGAPCGIPAGAKSVSVNVAETQPAGGGHLRIYPADVTLPAISNLNFRAGQTRSNNAVLKLSADGTGRVNIYNAAGGTVQVIIDVNGYFQ